MRSPFWLLAIGLGVAFIVTSGRAQAVFDVLTSPIGAPSPYQGPGTINPDAGTCGAGQIWDQATQKCIAVNTPPQISCRDGWEWSDTLHACVPVASE